MSDCEFLTCILTRFRPISTSDSPYRGHSKVQTPVPGKGLVPKEDHHQCRRTQEDAKGQLIETQDILCRSERPLHGSVAPKALDPNRCHDGQPSERTGQRSQKDGEQCELESYECPHHCHKLDVAKAHGFNTAEACPEGTHDPYESRCNHGGEQRVGKREQPPFQARRQSRTLLRQKDGEKWLHRYKKAQHQPRN